MRKRTVIVGAIAVSAIGICIFAASDLNEKKSVFAEIIHESTELFSTESEESAEDVSNDEIIIPDDTAKYGYIYVTNASGTPISLTDNAGSTSSIDDFLKVEYSDPIIIGSLNEASDFTVSGNGFYYAVKGSSMDSVSIEPQNGMTISGNDFSYDLTVSEAASDKKISFSGSESGTLSISRENEGILLSSKLTLGDLVVNSGSENFNYQINDTRCMIKNDGSVTHEDGTEIQTASNDLSSISKEDLVQNVFHTIEPALFVRGDSSTIAKAAAYINDYVYDNEEDADALVNDTNIREYYEYYGENGQLSFTITILGSGNHARIATSDGEVHDYMYEPQEGAHCYPVFSLG